MKRFRHLIAFIIAPLITSWLLFVLYTNITGGPSSLGFELFIFIAAIPVSYTSSIVVGYPVMLYLKNKNKLTLVSLGLSGFIIGFILFGLVMIAIQFGRYSDGTTTQILSSTIIRTIFAAGISSLIGAIIFGVIYGIPNTINIKTLRISVIRQIRIIFNSFTSKLIDVYKRDRD